MKQKLESMIKKGKVIALAGLLSLAVGCASSQQKVEQKKSIKPKTELATPTPERIPMPPVFLTGKSLDDRFKDFNQLNPEQQVDLAKSLNSLSVWDTILLARYVPIDGILKELSSFYSTDYKGHLQTLLSVSGLNPITVGLSGDKGFGQISQLSEKWTRNDLYNNKKSGYKFLGPEISDNVFDPYTNLVLSSILFRKAAEEKVVDLDAVYSLYSNGFTGVRFNKDNLYVTNETGLNAVNKAKSFDSIADKLITFSWVSMNNPNLKKYIEDINLRKIIEDNNSTYDARVAYEDMVNFLDSISNNKMKYSEENSRMFKAEAANMFLWIKLLYNN